MRLLLAALLVAAALTVTAPAVAAPCSQAGARAAIASAHLKLKLLGDKQLIEPSQAGTVICHDFTRDGQTDMAVTIASGGTAGDVGWVVFRATSAGWKVSLTSSGYKLGLFRRGNDLENVQPI